MTKLDMLNDKAGHAKFNKFHLKEDEWLGLARKFALLFASVCLAMDMINESPPNFSTKFH
jgi:hypothetical protein